MRFVLGVYEYAASLELAVVLIFTCALALGWATFVESAYGTPAVQFGVYGTWWFALINLLLAVNIFCAAAIRYPWKRHQTGFVITHIGLLVLLFGCLMSRNGGIDAQMPIFEDQMGHRAFESSHHFALNIEKKDSDGDPPTVIEIPFRAGPFNWADYDTRLSQPLRSLENENPITRAVLNGFAKASGAAFRLASRDKGVVYDRDGIQLEVLDYYADSAEVQAPLLKLKMTMPQQQRPDADGRMVDGPEKWVPVELSVTSQPLLDSPFGIGGRQRMGGGSLVFMLAGSEAEVQAFLESGPRTPGAGTPGANASGSQGQVVLYAGGEATQIDVAENLSKGRVPLGKSGLEAEVVEFLQAATVKRNAETDKFEWIADPAATDHSNPMVRVNVYRTKTESDEAKEPVGKLILFADAVEFSQQDHTNGVFGSYWFDHQADTAEERIAGKGGARIDILQGPLESTAATTGPLHGASGDETAKLYYRYWNGKELVVAKELPSDGTPVDAFKMPIAQLRLKVDQHVASAKPMRKILPLPFDKGKQGKMPAARVRLTVDGKSSEFILAAIPGAPDDRPLFAAEKHQLASDQRLVTLTMPPDEVDIGFGVRLREFERKLDPGTSQPSHYSSIVDFVDLKNNKPLQENVVITMNAPVDFSAPGSGRSYRLFQESFFGPIRPGSSEFDKYAAASGRDELYMSTLTVNYDPGRGVKYIGCLLIVAGIATMFYMRAYFFKPAAKPQAVAVVTPPRKRAGG